MNNMVLIYGQFVGVTMSENGGREPGTNETGDDNEGKRDVIPAQFWRDWLQENHEADLRDLEKRLPDETHISLSVSTLKESCGEDICHDISHHHEIFENGEGAIASIRKVVAELVESPVDEQEIKIRWQDIPNRRLVGQYDAEDTERLISIEGQIDLVSGVEPVVSVGCFQCIRCGTINSVPQVMASDDFQKPTECVGCERQGPFRLDKQKSKFVDRQVIRLQTPPECVQNGIENLHVSVTGALAGEHTGDLGKSAVISGYLTTKDTDDWERPFLLQADAVELIDEVNVDIENYAEEIKEFESMYDPVPKIVDERMLPDMYAPEGSKLRMLKLAVLLQACSPPRLDGKKRGDIHIFACGDPSTGKTAVAELADKIVPRSEMVSTRVTGVGLTAAGVHDELTGWTIKSGGIVRANNGILIIDELDKINNSHIDDLHYPMEAQRVSAAVADQSVTLPAETSVLATANPKYSRFDKYEPIGEQLDLPSSLLSRFDLIIVLTDKVEEARDKKLAEAVTEGYQAAIDSERGDIDEASTHTDVGFLRAWIALAQNYMPELPEESAEQLRNFFRQLRKKGEDEDSPIPVTVRKLEGLNRLAIASARARHSDVVEDIDVRRAIQLVRSALQDVGIDPETGEFDADIVETGTSKSQRDRVKSIKSIIEDLCEEYDNGAPYDEIIERGSDFGLDKEKVEDEIARLSNKGKIYEPCDQHFRLC